MEITRASVATRLMLAVAAGSLAAFLGVCLLYGWYVGGRPPGWIEGKFLFFPIIGWSALCAFPAIIVAMGGTLDIVRSGLDGIRSLRFIHWASLMGAVVVCALLVGQFWYPWGLAVVYSIAGWRQGMWMPEQEVNPIFVL